MTRSDKRLSDAIEALDDGDVRDALACARAVFGWPSALGDHADASEAALVMARIGRSADDPSVETAARTVASSPDDVDALYDLGYALLEQRLGILAAGVLARAHRLAPRDARVLSELACALEVAMRYRDMVTLLESAPAAAERSFMCRYLRAFATVMSGDLPAATAAERTLEPADDDRNELLMASRIRAMLERAHAVRTTTTLDSFDLRGWHWVTQGSILTSTSPFGREDGMNGRWAWTQDSHDRIRFGIDRLQLALRALDHTPRRVIALPDRPSTIVAHATATILGLPLTPWNDQLPADGLVVAYDLATAPGQAIRPLRERHPALPLFAHALCWTEAGPVAPDLTTLLYQSNTAPWEPHIGVDPDTMRVIDRPADDRPAEAIASDIVDATPATSLDVPPDARALTALCQTISSGGEWLPKGLRSLSWAGSPVPSARFA